MKKAAVYIWPRLNKEQMADIEEELIDAGYKGKKLVTINGHEMWRCT